MKFKNITKWHCMLMVVGIVILVNMCSGPSNPTTKPHATDAIKQAVVANETKDVVDAFSFTFPDLNAKVEMRCVTPGAPDGFEWYVSSLDGKHPPKGNKVFFNFQKERGTPIVSSNWRGILPVANGKTPTGDAFMVTAVQMSENLTGSYKYYVFGVGNTLEDVKRQGTGILVSVKLVTNTSSLILSNHVCSTMKTQ